MDAMYSIEDQRGKSEHIEGCDTQDMGHETWGKGGGMWSLEGG